MVVKIRLGRGPVVTRRDGKNSRIAMLAASLLTLFSISFATLGIWRLCQDLGWAGDFVFQEGIRSHWQVGVGAAILVQYACWRLTRYARLARERIAAEQAPEESATRIRAAANV